MSLLVQFFYVKTGVMKNISFITLIFLIGLSMNIKASNPDNIIGVWKSSSDQLMIKIDKIGDQFQGRIVWYKPSGEINSILDEKNPEVRLRKIPLKGNKIIQELSFNPAKSTWEGGTFYNHKDGKKYSCLISLQNSGEIKIIKYIQNNEPAISETWTRQ